MATKAVLRPTVVKYRIGEDITQEKFDELVLKIGDWFSQIRTSTKEPVVLAKRTLQACLEGIKPRDGGPWDSVATSSLATRIRIACRYDMDTMKAMETGSEKNREKKRKERASKKARSDKAKIDQNYPEEYHTASPVASAYGDDPLLFFTQREREQREVSRQAYLEQFPQLNNVAALPKLDQLLDLQLLQGRIRFRVAQQDKSSVRASEREIADIIKQVVDLEKAMGIDPMAIAKTQRDKEGGTIGDALRRFEAMGNYGELRERWWAEELLLWYQAYMTPSPRTNTGGYQLDEVGLYALTKTRVVSCPHCGKDNWGGFAIEEIEQWLVSKGHLKALPALERIDTIAAEPANA